jgi:hypothetical protein
VSNPSWGKLFGYKGNFQVKWLSVSPNEIPKTIFPRRTETRE